MTKRKTAVEKYVSDYLPKPKKDPNEHIPNHPRRDRSRTPLESFSSELMNWLRDASEGEVRLKPTTPEERRRAPQRMIRFRELRTRMIEEKHAMANQVAGVMVAWSCECGKRADVRKDKREPVCDCGQGEILLRQRDGDLSGLKASFVRSLEITPKSDAQLAKEAAGAASIENFLLSTLKEPISDRPVADKSTESTPESGEVSE